ncbi:ATP-binding protein [Nonomuraea aurantiaca]|uniref:ATP-binding protein n=1 Tax=Nonomuraea aurantiaca TaxID=2878562 RepID=UPI001CD9CA28|nr:LuxR C-terminal-related transcriptional regulator [Nonomuraea aurantiaca]MCA2225684.1 LuxR C-terminal-related transcriptional regulator [Nonomuraea aurantiaca]
MVPGKPREVSPREAEVLAGVAEHLTNAQIAHRLRVSVRTVESHVSSLLRKYGLSSRTALAAMTRHQPSPSAKPGRIEGIPVSHTSFIGRRQERQEALAALAHATPVCLVGPGGVGKTRLGAVVAQAASTSFPAGGAFVDLAPIGEGYVLRAVADALGLAERPPQPLEQAVTERVALGRSLLVLDNCEHLLDEVSDLVERLRSACPQAGILIAGRERPGLAGERVITVPPLAEEAAALFLDRARAIDPAFAAEPSAIAEVCARLDGLPLAIELAASRVPALGIDALRVGLQDRLRLLSGARGRPPRHRSLRAVIGWSYDLLDDEERALLRRLAVFIGGFNLAAATAIMPDTPPSAIADVIGRLTDKSLVGAGGGGCWRLLETIRVFAADQLEDRGEREETLQLRLRWAAGTAATLESRLDGGWRPQFDLVADDLRATLADTATAPDRQAHQLARSLAHLTFARRFHREAIGHYLAAADRAGDAADRHQDLLRAAATAVSIADGPLAFRLLMRAADQAEHGGPQAATLAAALMVAHRYRGADDRDSMSVSALLDKASADPADSRTAALVATARAWDQGGLELAGSAVDAARACGDTIVLLGALDVLTRAYARAGRLRTVQRICQERLTLIEHLPAHEPAAAAEIVDTFHSAARAELCVGDLPAALAVADRAQREDPIGEHPYLSIPKTIRPLALSGRFPEVFRQAPAMWDAWHQAGSPRSAWMSTAVSAVALAHGLAGSGEFDLWRSRALEMARAADAASAPVLAPFAAFVEARVALHTGAHDRAATLVEHAFAPFAVRWYEAYARAAGAELAVVAGLPDAADRLAAALPYAEQNAWAAATLARTRAIFYGDRAALAEAIERWTSIDARFERACTLRLLPGREQEASAELRAIGL